MKRLLTIILSAILITTFAACANFSETPPQDTTIHSKEFKIVKLDDITAAQLNNFGKLKEDKGYIYWQENGSFYFVIFAGEKSTGGYQIDVKSIEDNEGKTNILIDIIAPQDMATQMISYPFIVIKTTGITNNFNIKDTKGQVYNQLSQDLI